MDIYRDGRKLTIELTDEDEGKKWEGIINELWEEYDIEYINSAIDGWQYLYDQFSDLVFSLTDYNYNKIEELFENNKVVLEGRPNLDEWEYWGEYEWNEHLRDIYNKKATLTIRHGDKVEIRHINSIIECENKTELDAYLESHNTFEPVTIGNVTVDVHRKSE